MTRVQISAHTLRKGKHHQKNKRSSARSPRNKGSTPSVQTKALHYCFYRLAPTGVCESSVVRTNVTLCCAIPLPQKQHCFITSVPDPRLIFRARGSKPCLLPFPAPSLHPTARERSKLHIHEYMHIHKTLLRETGTRDRERDREREGGERERTKKIKRAIITRSDGRLLKYASMHAQAAASGLVPSGMALCTHTGRNF